MTEQHRRKWTFSIGNDEIRPNRTAFWTRIANVVEGAVRELFDDVVVDVERLFGVVVEQVPYRGLEVTGRWAFICPAAMTRNEQKQTALITGRIAISNQGQSLPQKTCNKARTSSVSRARIVPHRPH